MKIILIRFEKEKINFLESDTFSGNLVVGDKESISLESVQSRGEKYNKIFDELLQIKTKYNPDLFAYHSPEKYKGIIKDQEGFANSAVLHLFCHQEDIDILELNRKTVRRELSISNNELKKIFYREKTNISSSYKIAKSNIIIDGLTLLFLMREKI